MNKIPHTARRALIILPVFLLSLTAQLLFVMIFNDGDGGGNGSARVALVDGFVVASSTPPRRRKGGGRVRETRTIRGENIDSETTTTISTTRVLMPSQVVLTPISSSSGSGLSSSSSCSFQQQQQQDKVKASNDNESGSSNIDKDDNTCPPRPRRPKKKKKRKRKKKKTQQEVARDDINNNNNGDCNDTGSIVKQQQEDHLILQPETTEGDDENNNDNDETQQIPTTTTTTTTTTIQKRRCSNNSGNIPNVHWGAIPIEHLREHPNFVPLPHPGTISDLENLDDVNQFRQGTWQWDTIRQGRVSTSIAASALGFLESMQGEMLNVPKSWRTNNNNSNKTGSHAPRKVAFARLKAQPLRTIEQMRKVLCCDSSNIDSWNNTNVSYDFESSGMSSSSSNRRSEESVLWEVQDGDSYPFVARYNGENDSVATERKKKLAQQLSMSSYDSIQPIRLAWGNAQEATSLLTALNYFAQDDPRVTLKEVGMCGAGLLWNNSTNATSSSRLLIGASPDAILCHSDGRIEALEAKNHCPFFTPYHRKSNHVKKKNKKMKGKSSRRTKSTTANHRFMVGDRSMFQNKNDETVFPHLIPQLMMEMLCLGPECQSAVVVRQTGTKGALILRIYRDDDWIGEMIHYLGRFQREYVDKNVIPPPNFFLVGNNTQDTARYRRFLNKTLEIRNKVKIVARIPQDKVQRAKDAPFFLD